MAYNGSGTWVRLYNWTNDAAAGIKIRADRMDAETNDMCNNGLSAVMTRDGQGSPSANIPWNGYNITGVGALGIGMVPSNILDITQNLNGVARAELLNGSAGSAAVTQWSAYNSSAICNFGITGSGFTPSGALGANTGFLTASGPVSVFTSLSNTLSLGTNNTTRMTIDPSGVFALVAGGSGGVTLTASATSWAAISDERLKTPFTPFTDALAKVATIKTGTGRFLTDKPGFSRSFLSAQDVQKVVPEAVDVLKDGHLGVRYTDVIPLLIAALAEAKARIETLEAKA